MNKRSHLHKKADSSASNPVLSQFQSRPNISQAKPQFSKPLTQTQTENQEFQQQKFEATKLELQAKYGTITPEGQEQLTVLQAKMSGLLQRRLEQASGNGSNLANIPISRPDAPSKLAVQTKLTIGEPGDKYEREADRVAKQVVNRIHAPVSQQAGENVQREEISEEDKDLQMKPMLQLRAAVGGMTATADVEREIQQVRGGGQPLAANIRQPMEQAFGADFSKVKVHTDTQADQLNQSIQAKAFTTGQDVFFRKGEYNPGSRGGQELLAHELTHVVQQGGGAVQRSPQTNAKSNQNFMRFIGKERIQETGEKRSGESGLAGVGKEKGEKGQPKPRHISQLNTRSQQLKHVETANTIMTIETRPARESTGEGVIQREFAVQVTVNRPQGSSERVISEVRFGDRPNTQFGASQQDHVTAWTLVCNEIQQAIMNMPLKDAPRRLALIMDDKNEIMENAEIGKALDYLVKGVQEAQDDLDYQQIIQTSTMLFLTAYNADPKAVRKRQGARDHGEGARVKLGKDQIVQYFGRLDEKTIEADKDKKAAIEKFVTTLDNTFQYTPNKSDLANDRANNFQGLSDAIAINLITGINLISNSALAHHSKQIMYNFVRRQINNLGLNTMIDELIVIETLQKNSRFWDMME